MRLNVRPLLMIAAAAGLLACAGSPTGLTEEQRLAQELTGSWSEILPPFTGFVGMDLAAVDTVVTGSGHYGYEAGNSGTFDITGRISGSTVTLTLTFDYGDVYKFTGGLDLARHLTGAYRLDQPGVDPVTVQFEKIVN